MPTMSDARSATQVIGEQVRRLRGLREWSQETLATRLEDTPMRVRQTNIAKLENGNREASADDLWSLARVLNVPLASLMVPANPQELVQVGGRPERAVDLPDFLGGQRPLDSLTDPDAYRDAAARLARSPERGQSVFGTALRGLADAYDAARTRPERLRIAAGIASYAAGVVQDLVIQGSRSRTAKTAEPIVMANFEPPSTEEGPDA